MAPKCLSGCAELRLRVPRLLVPHRFAAYCNLHPRPACLRYYLLRPSGFVAQGFLGWIAYLGAAFAGVPISILVKNYGWGAFFTALMASSLIAFALLVPILNEKSFKQKQIQAAALAS